MGNLRKWSTTATGNASVAGGASTINMAEGMAPSAVNNSTRELMAQVRGHYRFDQWAWVEHSCTASVASQTTVKISGNETTACVASRAIRLTGGSTTCYATIVSSSFTAETTITITGASGSLSASMTVVALGPQAQALPATSVYLTSGSASAMIATQIAAGAFLSSASASTSYERLGIIKALNEQNGTSYDFVLADAGKLCYFSNGASTLVRIPTSASIAFAVPTYISVTQGGAGTVSFTAGAGVTVNSFGGSKQLAGRYAGAQLVKVATGDFWILVGNLA